MLTVKYRSNNFKQTFQQCFVTLTHHSSNVKKTGHFYVFTTFKINIPITFLQQFFLAGCVHSYALFAKHNEPPPKPGQCPHTLYTFPSRLGCSSDQDCEDYEKCCTYNCGSVCVAPHYIKALCPDSSGTGTCQQECECDDDCKRGKKCCFNGCAKECMPPKIVKPGFCGFPTFSPCGVTCLDNGYCSGDDKCCPSFCGHFCRIPI
ncbi:perlwapin-like [Nothobranchius furzeri]|uniref:perlwapin-like n=1 Tax=Nothobranchius furzeri TaxID=105023 RepID=UPI0024041403|nr:WAP four-disulfide core domain protein 3-like [Nothobranchius furzeri]